ncbi:AraC family ligand binding domain-containing protein [Pseudoflavonifractor sp. 60]|uniref:AraC family ligand binding domain-containing protein n=1 Tax=Pseudoflavonifractor sp. 60 TaxID=2304576 RepID=UPI001FACC525|nr:AraC family ligand binding domain-containing protein [Pseudoflavonifractor sp. 60]
MNKDIWTDRQVMLDESAFEFHHYLDHVPPKVEFHQHPFYEVFLFLGGNVSYTIEGKTYKLLPGDILLTNSLDIHRPEISPGKPYERIVIWLDERFFEQLRAGGDDLASCFADAARKDYRRIRPDQSSLIRMRNLCAQISQAQNSRAFGSFTLVCAYLFEFLVEVCRCYFNTSDTVQEDVTENDKINGILAYIN